VTLSNEQWIAGTDFKYGGSGYNGPGYSDKPTGYGGMTLAMGNKVKLTGEQIADGIAGPLLLLPMTIHGPSSAPVNSS
jgi:hypothetical protein